MIYAKTNPIGIDAIIQKVQEKLFNELSEKWNVVLDGYPRCYVIEREQTKTIEHFVSKKPNSNRKSEYSGNLIVAEGNKFFFIAENEENKINNLEYQTRVSLFFILNLPEIYPEILHRCDNEVLVDIITVIDNSGAFTKDNIIIRNFKRVFYEFTSDTEQNMQPYYCLRIELNTLPFLIDKPLC